MKPVSIVAYAPSLGFLLRIVESEKQVPVRAFVPHASMTSDPCNLTPVAVSFILCGTKALAGRRPEQLDREFEAMVKDGESGVSWPASTAGPKQGDQQCSI